MSKKDAASSIRGQLNADLIYNDFLSLPREQLESKDNLLAELLFVRHLALKHLVVDAKDENGEYSYMNTKVASVLLSAQRQYAELIGANAPKQVDTTFHFGFDEDIGELGD